MKLARKIIVLMLTTFLGVLAALGYFESRRAIDEYRAHVASELILTGHALRAPFGEVLDVEGEARALKLLETADADITHMSMHWIPFDAVPESDRARLAAGENVTVERRTADGPTLFVYVPATAHGAIELTQTLTEERTVVLGIVRERLVVAVVAMLGAALLSIIAGVRIVGEPMKALADHARRIGSGNLVQRLELRGNDEITELAHEMDRMADRLLEARARADRETDAKLKAMEQLRHVDRLSTVGTLASGMAHELGTPLSVVAGRAKMITDPSTTRDECVDYARVISSQVERMTKIMRGLLDFARRTPTDKTRTNVRELAGRVVDLLTPLAKKRDVVLAVEASGKPAFANVDATQVEQAVANLVVNGVHAITGGGAVVVEVEERRALSPKTHVERDWLVVSVRDDGDGIRKEDLPHVFEPFFTTKEVGEGTGLGLSVTYAIVEEHDGFVDVASDVGRGSRFSLYFPVVS